MSIEIEGIPDCILRERRSFRSGIQKPRKWTCRRCFPECSGVAEDYLLHFGWAEIWSMYNDEPVASLTLFFSSEESTRSIRKRLMLAAKTLPSELRVLGDFSHPQVYSILREVQRLSIPKIWLVGDLKPLRKLSKLELIRLRSISVLCHLISSAPLPTEVLELYERWSSPEKRFYIGSKSISNMTVVDRWFTDGQLSQPPYFRIGWKRST